MSNNDFKAGDKVIIDPLYATASLQGRIFEVARRMKVNFSLTPVDGVGCGVTAPPAALLPAPAELLTKPIVTFAPLTEGSTVRVKARNIDPTQLFVVISNRSKVKIAELGSEDGRYWTVPRSALEKVTIDLAAAAASARVTTD
ncbi:hypothetical protein ACFTWF_34855 [Rhodococcus sp. NPDC056960]|uniref:hypothetical protein n=1 Tax=Rhodococcus sp. NPDC056960 TaxID=3345982 RepID=UPI0036325A65